MSTRAFQSALVPKDERYCPACDANLASAMFQSALVPKDERYTTLTAFWPRFVSFNPLSSLRTRDTPARLGRLRYTVFHNVSIRSRP